MLGKKNPKYKNMRVIGNKKPKDEFAVRGKRSTRIGYPYCQKGYKLMNIETNKIFVSRDVVFHEDIPPFIRKKGENNIERALRDTDHHSTTILKEDLLTFILRLKVM